MKAKARKNRGKKSKHTRAMGAGEAMKTELPLSEEAIRDLPGDEAIIAEAPLRRRAVVDETAAEKKRGDKAARTYTFGGGLLGLVGYLAIGLVPSIVYGGYAGIILAGAIFGTPLGGSMLAQAMVVFTVVAVMLSMAALFVLVGAVFGSGIYAMVASITGEPEAAAEKAAVRTR